MYVKLSLKSLRNVVEYEEALKSALASSASGTYGGMLVDVYVGVVSGSSPEAVKLGYEHVRRKLRGPSSAQQRVVDMWNAAKREGIQRQLSA